MAKQPKMPNMQQMLKQVEKMQRDIEEAEESLKHEQVQASAGGGMVKAVVSGDLVVKQISIDPDAVDPDDPEMLGDLVMAAVNEALRAAQELQATRMDQATGGLGGPGGPLGGLGGLGGPPTLGGLGMPGL
jgi:nucleoid-associated protein EbfC